MCLDIYIYIYVDTYMCVFIYLYKNIHRHIMMGLYYEDRYPRAPSMEEMPAFVLKYASQTDFRLFGAPHSEAAAAAKKVGT